MELGFTINSYDKDGDIWEEGIYIHFGETRIMVAKSFEEYEKFINNLTLMKQEIKENIEQ